MCSVYLYRYVVRNYMYVQGNYESCQLLVSYIAMQTIAQFKYDIFDTLQALQTLRQTSAFSTKKYSFLPSGEPLFKILNCYYRITSGSHKIPSGTSGRCIGAVTPVSIATLDRDRSWVYVLQDKRGILSIYVFEGTSACVSTLRASIRRLCGSQVYKVNKGLFLHRLGSRLWNGVAQYRLDALDLLQRRAVRVINSPEVTSQRKSLFCIFGYNVPEKKLLQNMTMKVKKANISSFRYWRIE